MIPPVLTPQSAIFLGESPKSTKGNEFWRVSAKKWLSIWADGAILYLTEKQQCL
ncbi:hypothetical protein HMPREF0262_01821 [Clostridium sp. ATCC 29733]|nr:hypothetical protein HMPREF0262_01821 [Clostridium sp. ATCC 29733]